LKATKQEPQQKAPEATKRRKQCFKYENNKIIVFCNNCLITNVAEFLK
jgi:hypothetical protein